MDERTRAGIGWMIIGIVAAVVSWIVGAIATYSMGDTLAAAVVGFIAGIVLLAAYVTLLIGALRVGLAFIRKR